MILPLSEHFAVALSFMPARLMSCGPPATLSFRPAVSGTMLAWYSIGLLGSTGHFPDGVDRLEDDPASGWALVGTARIFKYTLYVGRVLNAFVYGRRVVAGSVEPWTVTGSWAGGLAFSTNDSLAALKFHFSFTSHVALLVVYEHGVSWMLAHWAHNLMAPLHSFLQGAYYLTSMNGQRDAQFHTSVAGTLILIMSEESARKNFAQLQVPGWWSLGFATLYHHNRYAFWISVPVGTSVRVSIVDGVMWAFSSSFDIGTTTATTTGALAYWSHDFWYVEHSDVLEAGVHAVTSRSYRFDTVPEEMAGIVIWPSLELHYLDQLGSWQLTTVVSGAVFAWAREHGTEHGAIHLLDDDPSAGWAYFGMGLHSSKVGLFITYTRNVGAGAVVDIPFVAPWLGGVGFGNATTATHPELPVSLKHMAWSFDDIPRTLRLGSKAWFDVELTYSSVPAAVEDGLFWPGLGQSACPIGSLIVAPSVHGEVYVCWRSDINRGGIDTPDDNSSSGWTLLPSACSTSAGASSHIFVKVVATGCPEEIPITVRWTGGVGFKQIATLPVGIVNCSTTSTTTSATSTTSSTSPTTASSTTSSTAARVTSTLAATLAGSK